MHVYLFNRPQPSPQAVHQRSGFTLLELLLVLAIMVLIASIVAPTIGSAFERQKLRGATETMRLAWDETRLKAMRTGQAQVFSCELGTGDYSIKPLTLQFDATNVGSGATLATTGGLVETQNYGAGTVAVAAVVEDPTQTLEDEITFVSCLVATDVRSYNVAQESQRSGVGVVNTQTIGQSVIFYPDGSTSTAELQLQNKRGDIRGVQLRGLTGHCRVIDVSSVPSDSGKS